ncbi:MAG: UDP-N-acetylmuramoyl-L-alanyl-D-glutamate--2,6-diaminopimelate ligase [Pseudomonadota bacterium]
MVEAPKDMRTALTEVLSAPAWQQPDMALLEGLPLKDIASDSREVKAGIAFAAFPGEGRDGRDFIPDAIGRNASAILCEARGFQWRSEWQVPHALIPELKQAIGAIASNVYGKPSEKLWTVGVTGTNGKTSCSTWIAEAFDMLGKRAGVIGTLGSGLVDNIVSGIHTTPDAVHLQRILADLVRQSATSVAMEASSHGLIQGRVNGVAFDVALFTNLSRDHLDYHGDMVAYGTAKARLFAMPGLKHAVINIDDKFGEVLAEALEDTSVPLTTYGIEHGDLAGMNVEFTSGGIRMDVTWNERQCRLESPLLGAFNAHNLLGVIGVLLASGISLEQAVQTASQLRSVPGRLQHLGGKNQPVVVIDYAHTPDALEKVLKTLRPAVEPDHKLICVFGCGGDRDRGKRPQMGAVAAELSDVVIVTSDNPRSESADAIIDDILAGVTSQNMNVMEDREHAIQQAISMARPGDVVLVAGKGHETYQEVHGVRRPFSDLDVAGAALKIKGGGVNE